MKIAFLGLGPMGAAMAGRLLAYGHELTVWNRTPGKAEALVNGGARLASSPAEAGAGVEIALTSLAEDVAVDSVVLGQDGLIGCLGEGALHVSLSTVSTELATRLTEAHAARGQLFVSAPVLGRPPAAADGKLFAMAAGDPNAVERARPLLETVAQRLFVLGEQPAQASLLKLLCNFLIFSTIEQMGEVFALGEKGGLDRASVLQVLTESFFTAPVHKNYGKLILDRAYAPGGTRVDLAAKDTRLLLKAAEALSTPMPIASLVRDRYVSAQARGEGDLDFTVIARHAAQDAGLEE